MDTDVLFINPGNHRDAYQELAREYAAIDTPVWASLLSSYIRERGYTPAIFDANVEGWSEDSAKDILSRYNPNLIVLMVYGHNPSASTQTMPAAGRIAMDIKGYNSDIPIAMGGTHPSALPEKTLREEAIDYVIQGEGPYTIEGLLHFIRGRMDIRDVMGLWYRGNDTIRFTSPSPLVSNLDEELGGYAWDLLPDLNNYRAFNSHCFQYFGESRREDLSDVRSPYASIYTSLGCPYSCHYCCINAVFGKPGIRYWSVAKVVSWIDVLVERFGVKNIRIADELFILSPERIERLCDMIIERGYDLNIWAYGRVDTIRESLLGRLKKAGINWICLGIESGNRMVRAGVNKRIGTDIISTVRLLQAYDIYVVGNYMFGLPEDNMETMEETFRLAQELNCEFANFYTVMAYPGSELYRWASEKDGYLPENWSGFSQLGYETKPLPTKYLSDKEVLRFRDDAFIRYYSNERYLNMIGERFGERVRHYIIKMLDTRLKRRILEPTCCMV